MNIIKTRSLLSRKEEVVKKIKEFKNVKEIEKQYIFLLKLLINDNTNKEWLLIYLDFINKNEEQLRKLFSNKFEEFKDELDYYSLVFTKDENQKYFNLSKASTKEELFNFLNLILNLDSSCSNDIKNFENILNSCEKYFENNSLFNMPIDFPNEQLFYYRNNNLIKLYLKNISIAIKEIKTIEKEDNEENESQKYNKEEMTQKLIKRELIDIQRKLQMCINALQNLNDKEKINYLIILLIKSSSFEEFNYGYNLITSNKIMDSDVNDYLSEIDKKNEKEKKKIKSKINKIDKINYQDLCLKNIELSDDIFNYEYYKMN